MKKVFIFILLVGVVAGIGIAIFFMNGSNSSNNTSNTTSNLSNTEANSNTVNMVNELNQNSNSLKNEVKNETKVDTFKDDNPIKLGIYSSDDSGRFLQTVYSNVWEYHKDINTFNVFYSQEEELENTSTRICYGDCLEGYDEETINKYRNGFHIRFTTSEGVVDKTILSPKDTEEFYDFLEVYLYDSYNRKAGEWYSHTTEEEFNDKTTLTSIKLTAGTRVDEISSDIELMAFSYDDDDFDAKGNYRGNSKYSITVKRSDS